MKHSANLDTIDKLFEIVRTLRSENGCSWDRKQTPETMWKCLIEEVYELQEAIVKKEDTHICEEIGDVLFQLIFILEMYQDKGTFFSSDVIDKVSAKMIRRHPHVYETKEISSEEELYRQWDDIKAIENKENGVKRPSVLDSVPTGMPSLIRAHKVSKCVVKQGFDWNTIQDVIHTAKEEIHEFEEAIKSENKSEAMMEFGDVLFSLVNVARFARIHPETALAKATAKFEGRYRLMEKALDEENTQLKNLSREKIDSLWDQAKKTYAGKNDSTSGELR